MVNHGDAGFAFGTTHSFASILLQNHDNGVKRNHPASRVDNPMFFNQSHTT